MISTPRSRLFAPNYLLLPILSLLSLSKGVMDSTCRATTELGCPVNWTETTGPRVCLRLYRKTTDVEHIGETCAREGALPAIVDTRAMVNNMKKYLSDSFYVNWWLALNDRAQEGTFDWQEQNGQGDPIQDPYWKFDHPLSGTEGEAADCVAMDSSDFRWINVNCEDKNPFMCWRLRQANAECPSGQDPPYIATDNPDPICVMFVDTKMTWSDAFSYCQTKGGGLAKFFDRAWGDAFADHVVRYTKVVVGLSFGTKKNKWRWINRGEVDSTIWAPGEPSGNTNEKCAAVDREGKFYDINCEGKHKSVCETESKDSPRDVRMSITYHVPPNHLFEDMQMNVTCTGIHTDKNTFLWFLTGRLGTLPATLSGQVQTKTEAIKTSSGTCANKTTSTFSFTVTQFINSLTLSCFAFDNKRWQKCVNPGERFSFCDRSEPLAVIRGTIKSGPKLLVSYDGFPGMLSDGGIVTAACLVEFTGDGALIWVVYFPSGPKAFQKGNDTVKFYREEILDEVHKVNSKIEFTLTFRLSGTSVACFAYDVITLRGDTLNCGDEELFCKKSDAIFVRPPFSVASIFQSLFSWMMLAVGILLVFIWCILILTPMGAIDVPGGEDGFIASQSPVTQKYIAARSSIRTKLGLQSSKKKKRPSRGSFQKSDSKSGSKSGSKSESGSGSGSKSDSKSDSGSSGEGVEGEK